MAFHEKPTEDGFVSLAGEEWYRIGAVDRMPPFLVSVVSNSDLWMYVSSRGGLTAGRVDADHALFPYVTDDLLHQCHPHTGPLTLVRVQTAGRRVLWDPIRTQADDDAVERNLYKNVAGNMLLFEERHAGLGLVFRARWASSERFGLVRTASLQNLGAAPVSLELIDGVQDLMPAGVPVSLQQGFSCLANAYTRAEVDAATGLGMFALQALVVDQAQPVESLKANTVWCAGLGPARILLCTDQLEAFRRGAEVSAERDLKGRRAAYLACASLTLAPGETRSWDLVADLDRGQVEVEALRALLASGEDPRALVAADVARGSEALMRNVASADGLQQGADRRVTAHHFANVLFNNMRGGVFANGHLVSVTDFANFAAEHNREVHARHRAALEARAGDEPVDALLDWARAQGDADLIRLAYEYLPLTFSRRHGDPSRPWNKFSIRLRNPDGSRALSYQGNWRDIFQNWEALSASFPAFIESLIAKFVNASTADGFNPYRLGREGVDWEVPEEGNPWSNIGYWGDHQIVYLLRLLEASERTWPGRLQALLGERLFTYADVPYRLKSAAEIARDPRVTIVFDHARERLVEERTARLGADGKLVHDAGGALVRATLAEKLIVPVLAKLGSLVLDGGVWMNTQRPEWNDANNALVGSGLSVVTLGHLRRYLDFCAALFERSGARVRVPAGLQAWLRETASALERHRGLLERAEIGDGERRALLDALQAAFETWRGVAYRGDLAPAEPLLLTEAAALFRLARAFVDRSLRRNRRPDGLYHAYNLLELRAAPAGAHLEPLYEMLEGQVSVLSAGLLSPAESLEVIDALFESGLWRDDQQSFLLYPDRALPGFLAKNVVPPEEVLASPLLGALLAAGERSVIARDVFGRYRFSSELRTPDALRHALAAVGRAPALAALVRAHGEEVVACFARVFELKRFTGRSGTMYGYEGLGCIYWHMVAKLLLAVQESHDQARAGGAPDEQVRALAAAYDRVRAGLGFNKDARGFGAFPTDPYSHTPRHAGAQQPGMTGVVKEIILTRFGELGVRVDGGRLEFRPDLLHASELLAAPADWVTVAPDGALLRRRLDAGELGFTYCQTPVVYRMAAAAAARVRFASGAVTLFTPARLDAATSKAVLSRSGAVASIEVDVAASTLRPGTAAPAGKLPR